MATPLSKAANQFAVDLFQCYLKRHGDKYRNLLLCPYLIYHSLAMMLVGAKGKTAQQLMKVLRIPSTGDLKRHCCSLQRLSSSLSLNLSNSKKKQSTAPSDDANEVLHREFLWLTEQLIHGNHDFVHLASFIYLDKSAKRTERYKTILRDYYETKPKKIDFDDFELMVKTVNEDVARTTENIYSDILSIQEAQKMEKSYMLLINAVFFRGFWLTNFTDVRQQPFIKYQLKQATGLSAGNKSKIEQINSSSKQHQQRNFTMTTNNHPPNINSSSSLSPLDSSSPVNTHTKQSSSGNKLQPVEYNVEMMSKLDYLPIVCDEQLDAKIVKMPFEASDLQMLLILPNNRQSDSTYLCDNISATKLNHIIDEFEKSKCRTVKISMPIFCIDSGKISIQSTLIQMGANDLFDKTKANMSDVCENKQVWLHKILHRCFIICDNRGSITSSSFEKAKKRQAKSEIGISSGRSGVEEFVADHPFMYIIMDSLTKTILLIGLYTDPSETLEVVHEAQLNPEEAHQIYTEGVYKI